MNRRPLGILEGGEGAQADRRDELLDSESPFNSIRGITVSFLLTLPARLTSDLWELPLGIISSPAPFHIHINLIPRARHCHLSVVRG